LHIFPNPSPISVHTYNNTVVLAFNWPWFYYSIWTNFDGFSWRM